MSFIDKLANEHNIKVIYKSIEDHEGFAADRSIYIDPNLYPPRMNWIFCHELAHILLGHTTGNTIRHGNEVEADEYAAELMLPTVKFRPLVDKLDLAELKERFPHASWEVIARRWVQFHPEVLTIFDNERLTLRQAPDGYNFPRHVSLPEQEIIKQCYDTCMHQSVKSDGLILRGYYVDDGRGVRRVLLLTEVES